MRYFYLTSGQPVQETTYSEFRKWGRINGVFQVSAPNHPAHSNQAPVVGLENVQVTQHGDVNAGFIWEVPDDRLGDFAQFVEGDIPAPKCG